MKLSILIPTYNEADIIGGTLKAIAAELGAETSASAEVLVVDDGKDNLPQIVRDLKPSLPFADVIVLRNSPPLGKGQSLANGFKQARGEIVGFLDADLSTPPSYIKTAVELIRSGKTDIFIGSRRSRESRVQRKQSALKTVLGDMLIWGVNVLIFTGGKSYRDTQCGFKFFRNRMAKVLYSELVAGDGLTDIEILIRANMLGYRVTEQGVTWTDERESKRSLKRILVGELVSISKIMYYYRLLGPVQKRKIAKLDLEGRS